MQMWNNVDLQSDTHTHTFVKQFMPLYDVFRIRLQLIIFAICRN